MKHWDVCHVAAGLFVYGFASMRKVTSKQKSK